MTMKKRIIYLITLLLIVTSVVILLIDRGELKDNYEEQLAKSNKESSFSAIESYISGFQNESNYYYSVRNKWDEEKHLIPDDKHVITPTQTRGGVKVASEKSVGYQKNVTYLKPQEELIFEVNSKSEGLYEIWLDYYILPESNLSPEIAVKVNGAAQYNEMNEIRLPVDWRPSNEKGEREFDRYGDEINPNSEMIFQWKSNGLKDPNNFFTEPLKFQFNKGKNKVSLSVKEGHILVGDIKVVNTQEAIPSYVEYRATERDLGKTTKSIVTIEAENLISKNRQSIRAKYVRDPMVTPYEYKNRVLNVLDGYSFADSGDEVRYEFNVEEPGYYELTMKYMQDTNNGMPTQRRIEIDGKVPFKELELYSFDYTSSWKNQTLVDHHGNPYKIYLDKGKHTLTLSINNSNMKDVYHELLTTLEAIDTLSKDIKKLTGGSIDKKRNWKIEQYIPEISDYLYGIAGRIEKQRKGLVENSRTKDLPVTSELEVAQNIILDFAEEPNKLPNYMNKFNEGETSAYSRIKSILPMLVYHPMHLDKFYVHNDVNLPSATPNVFTSLIESTKAFTYSFFSPKYNEVAEIDEDTIEVWVNQSRLYVEIMQRMIDEEFTPKTGVKVNLSLLPDENKIILSNSANSTPDAALGVSHARPFELALRGIIEDLRPYEGFHELANQFNPNSFVPFIYDQGVFAIPETQDVKLLFYRKDILEFLGEEPPQTWEDVISLVPMLQRYDMNFYTPLGSQNAYKGFDTTTPFIYQFGGQLYNETGSATVINQAGAYDAFDFMTSLFTVYNMPITTAEFYQNFRNGSSPIGIGDANTYIQLKYAAPELAGQWGIIPIPGIENKNGIIERWDPTYGSTGIIFSDSQKKNESWEFLRWWTEAETQSKFSYAIQGTLGNKFLYLTANIDGFTKSAWPTDSKKEILEQWDWIQATGKVPGDYMVEREISNAWNKVVFDKENPRIAIDYAVKTIDRELERKLMEFGYIKDNKLVRPYKVPTIENVNDWVVEDGKEHITSKK